MGYAHICTQHLSTKLNVWPKIVTSVMASEENALPNLQWVSPAQTQIALLQRSLWSLYKDSQILKNHSIEGPQWSHSYEENGQHYCIYWICCSVIVSRYHNRYECPFPGGAFKWLSGSGCKYENPLPGPFRTITSTKGDNLRSERKYFFKELYIPGGREWDILHKTTLTN